MMSTEAKEETKRSEEAQRAPEGKRQAQAQSSEAVESGQGASPAESVPEPKKKAPQLTEKAKQVVETIKAMSVLELAEVARFLKEEFGISDAVPMAVAGVPGGVAGASGGGEAAEEKTSFDVILAEVGANKIQVIKELRTVTTLGLKEAKDLVDAAPKPVKTGATKEEAENIKKKLEAAGAKVQLK